MSNNDLAADLGMHHVTVSKWRTGRMAPKYRAHYEALATRLEVALDWLYTGVGDSDLPEAATDKPEGARGLTGAHREPAPARYGAPLDHIRARIRQVARMELPSTRQWRMAERRAGERVFIVTFNIVNCSSTVNRQY